MRTYLVASRSHFVVKAAVSQAVKCLSSLPSIKFYKRIFSRSCQVINGYHLAVEKFGLVLKVGRLEFLERRSFPDTKQVRWLYPIL